MSFESKLTILPACLAILRAAKASRPEGLHISAFAGRKDALEALMSRGALLAVFDDISSDKWHITDVGCQMLDDCTDIVTAPSSVQLRVSGRLKALSWELYIDGHTHSRSTFRFTTVAGAVEHAKIALSPRVLERMVVVTDADAEGVA